MILNTDGDSQDFGRHRPVNEFCPDILLFDNGENNRDSGLVPCRELKLLHSIRHSSCLSLVTSINTLPDMLITQHTKGRYQRMTVYSCCNVNTATKFEIRKFDINFKVSSMLLISYPTYKVVAAFSSEEMLVRFFRLYADMKKGFKLLSGICVDFSVQCAVYCRELNELVIGGIGRLQRYRMAKGATMPRQLPNYRNIRIPRDQAVLNLLTDDARQWLIVQAEECLLIFNYVRGRMVARLPGDTLRSMTCLTLDRKHSYLIYALLDGTVKVWHQTVMSLVTQYKAHHCKIINIAIHPEEQLLVTAAIDGTVKTWSLENFEMQQAIDTNSVMMGFVLLPLGYFVHWTNTTLHISQLRQLYSLFAELQSSVLMMRYFFRPHGASRVIVSCDDGSIRIVSPSASTIVTTIYPITNTWKPIDNVFGRLPDDRVYVYQDSNVLIFDSTTSPCTLIGRLESAAHGHSLVLLCCTALHKCAVNEGVACEDLIFGGHDDGTISLLHSTMHSMPVPVRAHGGAVLALEPSSTLVTGSHHLSQQLLSCGSDTSILVWTVTCDSSLEIGLQQRLLIRLTALPGHVCLTRWSCFVVFSHQRLLNVAVFEQDMSSLLTSEVPALSVVDVTSLLMEVDVDEQHCTEVTGMTFCDSQRLLATTGADGMLKVWTERGVLVREIMFDRTLRGLCFLNEVGDLLLGYQGHLRSAAVGRYENTKVFFPNSSSTPVIDTDSNVTVPSPAPASPPANAKDSVGVKLSLPHPSTFAESLKQKVSPQYQQTSDQLHWHPEVKCEADMGNVPVTTESPLQMSALTRPYKYPVAPDGHIPNSVVRKFFKMAGYSYSTTMSKRDVRLYAYREERVKRINKKLLSAKQRKLKQLSAVQDSAISAAEVPVETVTGTVVERVAQPAKLDITVEQAETIPALTQVQTTEEPSANAYHPLLKRIAMTRWFQPFEGEPELIIVVQRLVNLLTTSNSGLFKKVCAALLAIGSEQNLELPAELMGMVVSQLTKRLHDTSAVLRYHAVQTLCSLGVNRNDVLAALLAATHDTDPTVHGLALDSLYQATGTTTHIDLISAMTKLGINPSPHELQPKTGSNSLEPSLISGSTESLTLKKQREIKERRYTDAMMDFGSASPSIREHMTDNQQSTQAGESISSAVKLTTTMGKRRTLRLSAELQTSKEESARKQRLGHVTVEENDEMLRLHVRELMSHFSHDPSLTHVASNGGVPSNHRPSWPPKESDKLDLSRAANLIRAALVERQVAEQHETNIEQEEGSFKRADTLCPSDHKIIKVKSLTLGRRYNIDDLHQLGTSKLLPDMRSNAQTKSQPGLPARRRSSEESADTTRSLESLSAWTRPSIAEPDLFAELLGGPLSSTKEALMEATNQLPALKFQYSDTWRDEDRETLASGDTNIRDELVTPRRKAGAFFSRSATSTRADLPGMSTVQSSASADILLPPLPPPASDGAASDRVATDTRTLIKPLRVAQHMPDICEEGESLEEEQQLQEEEEDSEENEVEPGISVTVLAGNRRRAPSLDRLDDVAKLFGKTRRCQQVMGERKLKRLMKKYEGVLKSSAGKTIIDPRTGLVTRVKLSDMGSPTFTVDSARLSIQGLQSKMVNTLAEAMGNGESVKAEEEKITMGYRTPPTQLIVQSAVGVVGQGLVLPPVCGPSDQRLKRASGIVDLRVSPTTVAQKVVRMMKETGIVPPASDEAEETGPSTEDSEETTSSELTMPKAVTKERWRELFDLPTAVDRRRHYENALRVAVTSRHRVLPPIVYVDDGTVLQQADPGTRLLKRLSCDPQLSRSHYRHLSTNTWTSVAPLPARLGLLTREAEGVWTCGSLDMDWIAAYPQSPATDAPGLLLSADATTVTADQV